MECGWFIWYIICLLIFDDFPTNAYDAKVFSRHGLNHTRILRIQVWHRDLLCWWLVELLHVTTIRRGSCLLNWILMKLSAASLIVHPRLAAYAIFSRLCRVALNCQCRLWCHWRLLLEEARVYPILMLRLFLLHNWCLSLIEFAQLACLELFCSRKGS